MDARQIQAFECLNKGKYTEAIGFYNQCIAINPEVRTNYWYLGLAHLLAGEEAEAELVWMSVLLDDYGKDYTPELVEILENQGNQKLDNEEFDAVHKIHKILQQIAPPCQNNNRLSFSLQNKIEFLSEEALRLTQERQYKEAEKIYCQALILDPENASFLHNLGVFYYELSRYEEAYRVLIKALKINNDTAIYYHNLGLVLQKLGQDEQAILAYNKAIELDGNLWFSYNNLAGILQRDNRFKEASEIYEKALQINPNESIIYINLANTLLEQKQYYKAIEIQERGIKMFPSEKLLYRDLIYCYQQLGKIDQAIYWAEQASNLFKEDWLFQRINQCLLPIIYDTIEDIDFYRNRFSKLLEQLIKVTYINREDQKKNVLNGLRYLTNFYLQYQGKNDLELQKKYGQLACRIMQANYPQWCRELNMPDYPSVRIGFISSNLRNHNGANWALGWIKNINKEKFKIYLYYTGLAPDKDNITKKFKDYGDCFKHIHNQLEALCEQVIKDKLHIIIYPDIGMNPETTLLASLRLAPVQATAWGHPVTSGLPTIDYYLSSDLMEPEPADEHYSEQLIRLPNLGLCYAKPELPSILKNRQSFMISESSIVYLSPQSQFKYLPQYDYIFVRIAQKVPQVKQSLFLFLFIAIFSQISLDYASEMLLQNAI